MTPLFQPQPVNGPFEDPAVYIDCLFERRALLFDLGDLHRLPPRKVLRLSHAFVSHTHMDHFMGFDHLLRISLGRRQGLHLFGPRGFVDQVGHKLAAYTWNLVETYDTDFTLTATEADPDGGTAVSARFRVRTRFAREELGAAALVDGVLLDEETFRVRCTALDHRITSLAFALEEKLHLNIWKNRLTEMGLPTGDWLRDLKAAIRRGEPDKTPIPVRWRDRHGPHERVLPLGRLREEIVRVVPGQKIAYVVDAVYHADNARRIVALAEGADTLFIETVFLDEDAQHAAEKYHLTATQAGRLAREARVKRLVPLHFSPRYSDEAARVQGEAQAAFAMTPATETHSRRRT